MFSAIRLPWLVLGTIALGAAVAIGMQPGHPGGGVDYTEYAAASQLLANGKNPYDARELLLLQQQTGWTQDQAQMMWNPPWVFPVVLPLALVPWKVGFLIWLLLQFGCVVWSAWHLADFYKLPRSAQGWAALAAIGFAPTLFLLMLGQSSGFLLAGLVAFLLGQERRQPILAGLGLALLGFKPHLFFTLVPLWAYGLACEPLTRRAVVVGLLLLVFAALFPCLLRPTIWNDYFVATQAPGDEFHFAPNQWDPPILAGRLSAAFNDDLRMQFAPSLLVGFLLLGWRIQQGVTWSWVGSLPAILLASLLSTGYGAWGFDLVLLLIPVFAAAGSVLGLPRQIYLGLGAVLAVLNTAMLLGYLPTIWWTPTIAFIYAVASWYSRRNADLVQNLTT